MTDADKRDRRIEVRGSLSGANLLGIVFALGALVGFALGRILP